MEEMVDVMGWYGNGMSTGDWVVMIAVMAVFWGLVLLVGVRIFRGSGGSAGSAAAGGGTGDRASEILDERFARGEVDRDEYEARKAALRGDGR